MDHTHSSSQRVAWHAAQTSAQTQVALETKGESGTHGRRVVVVVDPSTVVRSAHGAQDQSAAAAMEIRHTLGQLRQHLAMGNRTMELLHRCGEEEPTCRERAPRFLVGAGGMALAIAAMPTHSVPMMAVGVPLAVLGWAYGLAAPCTASECVEMMWLNGKLLAKRRSDLVEPSEMQDRIAGLEAVLRTLQQPLISVEVRQATRLPADLAGIIGEYADVDPQSQAPASSQTTMAPPQAQSMG